MPVCNILSLYILCYICMKYIDIVKVTLIEESVNFILYFCYCSICLHNLICQSLTNMYIYVVKRMSRFSFTAHIPIRIMIISPIYITQYTQIDTNTHRQTHTLTYTHIHTLFLLMTYFYTESITKCFHQTINLLKN